MDPNQIKPDKITKPIQLLAVWMTGLILLVSAFLTAAGTIKTPYWLPALFSISAVTIIPVFLLLVFLLQTKFRPEMQEDSFYSGYLDSITKQRIPESKINLLERENEYEKILSLINKSFNQLSEETKNNLEKINEQISKVDIQSKEIIAAKEIIKQADKSIDRAEVSLVTLRVNTRLNNYSEIIEKLRDLGATIGDDFGRENKIPSIKVITVGPGINLKALTNLLPTFVELGFKGINSTELIRHEGTVLVGSYATKHYNEITSHLIDQLKTATSLKFLEISN